MWGNAGISQHCRLSEMVDSSFPKYCAKLSFLFLDKISSSKIGPGDSVLGCTHRYVAVRIASSSWRIGLIFRFPSLQSFCSPQWTFIQHFQIFVLPQRGASFGMFLLYQDFFPPFLVSYSESLLRGGTKAEKWCQFTLLQITLPIFFS